jgi:hypothetical protein
MKRWGVWYGRWWMVQYALDWTFSLGIHIDPLRRTADVGPYGPYVDFHLGFVVVSVGYRPARANPFWLWSQGGIMRPESG